MPTTMVLRFRDLIAETIPEHEKLIGKFGYVWWAWWSKPDEKIPKTTFGEFQKTIDQNGHLLIYLLDSGKSLLYRAQLKEIDIADAEPGKTCKEPEKAPDYYSTGKFRIWFRLASIEKVPEEEIRRWAYDEVAEFLDDPAAERYQNKRVYNVQEMLGRRHRTIYFVKEFRPAEHTDYLVESVPAIGLARDFRPPPEATRIQVVPSTEPRPFTTTPIFRDSTHVLHLSDLHFSDTHHGFPLHQDRAHRPLASLLEEDLKGIGIPAAVIISGDSTWQGAEREYELAAGFVEFLQSVTGLRPEHFVLVPGNHDIRWAEQSGDEYDRSKPAESKPEVAEKNYRTFFERALGFPPNTHLSMGRRFVLGNYLALDIVGLNSSRLEAKHFAGYGYVGLEQLNEAADQMNWRSEKSRVDYRLVVMHHHIVPVTPEEEIKPEYSLTLDAGQLTYVCLKLEVDLVVHGHMHQPFASSVSRAAKGAEFSPSRSFAIHGAGSVGVKREKLGAIGKNSYSVYAFDKSGVTVRIRSMSESVRSFEDDWKFSLKANLDGGLLLG